MAVAAVAAAAAAAEVVAVLPVAAVEVAAVLPVAALEVAAALVSVFAALVSVFAALVSVYIADAHFLDAVSAAVVVAAVAAEAGAAELAGYGRPPGAGSTPAGPNLHRPVKKLASRPSQLHRQLLRVKNLTSRRSPSSR